MDPLKIHPLHIDPNDINMIAVPGGPCAGKSTILAQCHRRFSDMGICAITIPELATEYASNGITPGDSIAFGDFQEAILLGTIEREYRYKQIAKVLKAPGKKIVLTDRGRMDGMAYYDNSEEFFVMAKKYGYEPRDLCPGPYKAAIHLRSLACDNPTLYSCAGNTARTETIEQAQKRDRDTERAWTSHPHLRVIGNLDEKGEPIDIYKKATRLIKEVAHAIGVPVPLEVERKFRLKELPDIPAHFETIDITQHYLETPQGEERLRVRTWRGSSVYYRTIKRSVSTGAREEIESIITADEYVGLLKYVRVDSAPIQKKRIVFVWGNQYFELDVFSGRLSGLILLEIELTDINDHFIMPHFIGECREVTEDKRFSNSRLAKSRIDFPLWS